MKNKVLLILFLCIVCKLHAQERNFIKDSIAFEQQFLKTQHAFEQDYEKAKDYFITALPLLDSLSKKYSNTTYFLKRKADVLNKISVADLQSGDFETALKRLNTSIKIRNDYGVPDDAASSYYLKGIIWLRQGEFEKSKINYDSAYVMTNRNIAKGLPHHAFKATLLNLFGAHHANLKEINKAEYYFKKAIKFSDSLGDKNSGATNRLQYAEVISDLGRHQEALKLRQKALKNYVELGYKESEMNALSEIASSYNALGNYSEAYSIKKQHIEHLDKTGQKDRLMREYPYLLEILDKRKKYKEAFITQTKYVTLKDSLRNADNYRKLADLDAKFKYESQKSIDSLNIISERKLIEAKKIKKANTRFWSVVTFLLLLASTIGFLYNRNKQKIKEQAYQNILLNNKVASKTEEINELLTETITHIKSKERIAENLEKLATKEEETSLKSIIADLKASKADDDKLMLIKQNIEQVNFEFIKKLKTLHPDLTKTDIEICSLIRVGLKRKEVANLRNTSLGAVKTFRFRLKKKLQLSSKDKLDDYVKSI